MENKLNIGKTCFWYIDKALGSHNNDVFDESIPCKAWIITRDTGRSNITSYGNTWPVMEYRFYNRKKEEIDFSYKGWKIISLKDSERNNLYTFLEINIRDPENVMRYLGENSKLDVWNALIFLKNLSKYKSWEHFDVVFERDLYKKKIEVFEKTKIFKKISKKVENLRSTDIQSYNKFLSDNLNEQFYYLWIKKNYNLRPGSYPDYYNDDSK